MMDEMKLTKGAKGNNRIETIKNKLQLQAHKGKARGIQTGEW